MFEFQETYLAEKKKEDNDEKDRLANSNPNPNNVEKDNNSSTVA